jgi:hypothetical protein
LIMINNVGHTNNQESTLKVVLEMHAIITLLNYMVVFHYMFSI